MALFIGNAFSLNMVAASDLGNLKFAPISESEAKKYAIAAESVVGHADTAAVFTDVLGVAVGFNRVSLTLRQGDVLVVGQYKGPRLEEGCKTLPEGAVIEWVCVSISIPFSWDNIEFDIRDTDTRDISYIWDCYGPVSLDWLSRNVGDALTGETLVEALTEMMESVPSLCYGEILYVRVGSEWLEISNNCTTGEGTISTKELVELYL